MNRPRQRTIERDGVVFTIGEDADFSWKEIEAIEDQRKQWCIVHNKEKERMSREMLVAVLAIKKVFRDETGATAVVDVEWKK
jgi:hypothetical protein